MSAVTRAVPRTRVGMRTEVASLAVTVTGVFLLTIGGAIHFDLGDALLHRAPHYLVALFFLNAVGTLVRAFRGVSGGVADTWEAFSLRRPRLRAALAVLCGDPEAVTKSLFDKHHIFTVPIMHEEFQGIRITPNVYTTLGELDRFCDQMETIARHGLPS